MRLLRHVLLATLCVWSAAHAEFSSIHQINLNSQEKEKASFSWEHQAAPFDELLVSWNSMRPDKGSLLFLVRIKTDDWSPWMRYGEWGKDSQLSFSEDHPESFAKIFQDTVNTQKGKTAEAFEIKVVAQNGASLKDLEQISVCTSQISKFYQTIPTALSKVQVKGIAGQSQMTLEHVRCKDMCSPTSTSTVVNFLLGKKEVDPVDFAVHVRDMGFDIFGNWALNVAEAYNALKGTYFCRIERMDSFSTLHSYLEKNIPVVVSVKGDIPGAAKAYNSGHLMVVTGYDPESNRVSCIDSAFESSDKTAVSYALEDFLKAWGTRKNLSYVFSKAELD